MSVPVVWTERGEPGSLHVYHCTECAILMALVFGGHTEFPKGIYTVAEREAFVDAVRDHPHLAGSTLPQAVADSRARYGHALPLHGPADLPALLRTPNLALVLQGQNGNLPYGHNLRRWDPSFSGIHAVTILTMQNAAGQARWLDPEAPNLYAGQLVTQAVVCQWAAGRGWSAVVHRDQFLPPKPIPAITTHIVVAGDTLSGIAASHGISLTALLAFPENMRYRANPSAIFPGNVVRVR